MFQTRGFTICTVFILSIVLLLAGCNSSAGNKQDGKDSPGEEPAKSEKLEKLSIQAPAGVSIAAPLYKIVHDDLLVDAVEETEYLTWKTPDEMRSRISSGQVDVSAVPTYVGANLYNKGVEVELINTLIWGILYVVGPEGEPVSWEELKGQTIHVPFKGDMPDLVFQYLLAKNGLDTEKDIKIEYVSTPQEVVQLLAAGRAQYAVLPEHTASLAVDKAKKEGVMLQKVMSLQDEWAEATGKPARIPQAGIIVSKQLIEEHPETVEELQAKIQESIKFLKEEPAAAGDLIAQYQDGLEPQFIENLLPSLNIEFVTAQDAKEELEFFFEELASLSPDIIGGQLPDEGFYYQQK
ncbi:MULTISPECIES: ABC transporter substrate-binding protein [unclassified Sporosarcina]|uniref:ABC transporter substrate-binding protein n=1 Tax=unclassified Sporosarcina TaxID=2647733 RepID=UPI0013046C55|nr:MULTISPECIES: ABC transporter substrate-binding protein [unclassified Sporosarcina]